MTAGPPGAPPHDPRSDPVPGQSQFGGAVDRFDQRADELLEMLRGHPAADQLFLAASHLGDFSLIWHLIGITRGIIKRRPDQVVVLAAMLGVESLIVNQGVKRLFRRDRPTATGDDRLRVRQPTTSSFPSGHASSATFAATVLSDWDGPALSALWFAVAAVVGTSRAYVRIHHASDVVGGTVVGLLLGLIGRRIARRLLR
jgi:membrane-associated phospholipid phosphatase